MGARRIRTIKPEMLEDERASALSHGAWRLFVSLWILADDEGRFRASTSFLIGQVFHAHATTTAEFEGYVAELVDAGMAMLYTNKGQRYGAVRNWTKHQRIDKPTKSLLPSHDDALSRNVAEGSTNPLKSSVTDRDQDQGSGSGSGSGREVDRVAACAAAPLAACGLTDTHTPGPTHEKRRLRTAPSPEAVELAAYLLASILSHSPGHRGSPRTAETWAKDFDLAIRIDGRSVDQLRQVIDFAHRSPETFWRANVLSGAKLREKFDQLAIQSKRNGRHREDRGLSFEEIADGAAWRPPREEAK